MKRLHILCLLALLLLLGTSTRAVAADYFVKASGTYTDDPLIPAECLPAYDWPAFGKCCQKIGAGNGNGGGGDNGGISGTCTSGATCKPQSQAVAEIGCDEHETCDDSCAEQPPVCTNVDSSCNCTSWQTPVTCKCRPKCTIPDPVHYPYCCSVEDKQGYPCIKTCTLPNGDKVDIKENSPRCTKYSDCCYGERDANGNITNPDPVETQPGDPRDYCKLKCYDVCNDKLLVDRAVTTSDIFPECCTPPVPVAVACACCREPQNQPSSAYCAYFKRFFSCDDPQLQCPAGQSCTMTVAKEPPATDDTSKLPEFDPNYDPYLTWDGRFNMCRNATTNRDCRYICRGHGILAPTYTASSGISDSSKLPGPDSIWYKDYHNGSTPIENNYVIQVHGNCADDGSEQQHLPWPPLNQQAETCEGDGVVSSSGDTGGGQSCTSVQCQPASGGGLGSCFTFSSSSGIPCSSSSGSF